ncbi:MAG: VOC family protein [Burkholderiaceae bacterium]|jgi:catechol 2,3-dioxygenase-like lactoylglutathione lyase family enzyme|nr:VOC family protein [Burkholderiaceae bacterium]
MLRLAPVTTMLPVADLDRARRFYEDRLGLEPLGAAPDGAFRYRCANAVLALLPRPGLHPAEHTAISFEVADIEAELAALQAKGVEFEDYDLPELRTVEHVCVLGSEKAAWFRDSEGNYLCLHQELH